MKEFQKELKKIRIAAGITQQELSEILDIKLPTIKGWEQGRCLPNIKNLERFKEVFNKYEYGNIYKAYIRDKIK